MRAICNEHSDWAAQRLKQAEVRVHVVGMLAVNTTRRRKLCGVNYTASIMRASGMFLSLNTFKKVDAKIRSSDAHIQKGSGHVVNKEPNEVLHYCGLAAATIAADSVSEPVHAAAVV